jgi:hypothetical protein
MRRALEATSADVRPLEYPSINSAFRRTRAHTHVPRRGKDTPILHILAVRNAVSSHVLDRQNWRVTERKERRGLT